MGIVTVKEAAGQYKVCHATVLNWIKKGLPATKIGKVIRIDEDDLKKFIAAQNTGNRSVQIGGDAERSGQ